jgi:hypothetical protein
MLLVVLIILLFVGVGVGIAWYTGNLPGTKKYKQKKYMSTEVLPIINEMAAKNFSSDNKPSIEDVRRIRLVCEGLEELDIDPRSIPSQNKRVLEMCVGMTYMDVMQIHEFYRDFAALKKKDPTFENIDQYSSMCKRFVKMSENLAARDVSDFDTYKDDLKLLAKSCEESNSNPEP